MQKKSAIEEEERTKKAASTQSRQLSDLVNYAGEHCNIRLLKVNYAGEHCNIFICNIRLLKIKSIDCRGAQIQWVFRRAKILADVVVL